MENDRSTNQLPFLFQPSSRQVWVQAFGRFLYQAGYGTIQFYIPLIFVNQVGLSATVVGIGIGTGSLSGIVGHLLGGYLADSPTYGRKRALLFSAILSIIAMIALTLSQNLLMLVGANLLMGLSAGCYWTAADAGVVDVTTPEQRHKAFAIMVLADSLGVGLGIWGGSILMSVIHQAKILFLISSFIQLGFLALVLIAVKEIQRDNLEHSDTLRGFIVALRDRSLILFVLVNVLFTTYIALANTTLPLYFTNTVSLNSQTTSAVDVSNFNIANLFTWCYIGLGGVLQIPIVQVLSSLPKVSVLVLSMLLWGTGFLLVWVASVTTSASLAWIIASFAILAIATTIYKPFAPAFVAELAPESLRAVYLAISYQCWSIGYFIGPVVGGWVIDQTQMIALIFWVVAAISAFFSLIILYFLSQSQALNTVAQIAKKTASVPE